MIPPRPDVPPPTPSRSPPRWTARDVATGIALASFVVIIGCLFLAAWFSL